MPGLLPTTVVGSYPQPDWLIDRERLRARLVPRVRASDIWRVAPELLEQAQDDATLLAIRDMERAGIDIITDGEIRRESYSNHFALALDGVVTDPPGEVIGRTGRPTLVPRIVGPIHRRHAVEARSVAFLRANTDRAVKITLPGPFTLSQQAKDEFYGDDEALAMAFAQAVNAEAKDLVAAGADVIQLDEPWMQERPQAASRFAVAALNRALAGVHAITAVRMCFGYAQMVKDKPSGYSFLPQLADTIAEQISIEAAQPGLDLGVLVDLSAKVILLGVIDLGTSVAETPADVAKRLRAGLKFVAPERLVAAPDCGMKYLDRALAFAKLKALADGAAIVRQELA